MIVTSLSSGSSGNCYLVQAGKTNILIDCGLSSQKVKEHLSARNLNMSDLTAIFLTHEHSDHLKGAGAISRRWGTPIYANHATLCAATPAFEKQLQLEEQRATQMGWRVSGNKTYNLQVFPTGSSVNLAGLEVYSFPVSHDATETVCYTFKADNQQAVILTDLGCATPEIFEPLYNSDLIILEANHEREDLFANPRYSYPLKNRIGGKQGHLSNEQSAEILLKVLEQSGTQHAVWLAHLSEQNNAPEKALQTIIGYLIMQGIKIDFYIDVALRDHPSLEWDSTRPPMPIEHQITAEPTLPKPKKEIFVQKALF
jgi:phosphoribosyl 1,2-cyclic phosphodiesterase